MPEEQKQQIDIQRVYVKDLSLETPGSPQIFREEWQPDVTLDLSVKHTDIENDYLESLLHVTVAAKKEDKTIFLIEVQQAGIFHIAGFNAEEKEHIINVYCPSVLFPYAREVVSDMITRASFPPLHLTPINFEMLYRQRQEEMSKAEEAKKETE